MKFFADKTYIYFIRSVAERYALAVLLSLFCFIIKFFGGVIETSSRGICLFVFKATASVKA